MRILKEKTDNITAVYRRYILLFTQKSSVYGYTGIRGVQDNSLTFQTLMHLFFRIIMYSLQFDISNGYFSHDAGYKRSCRQHQERGQDRNPRVHPSRR